MANGNGQIWLVVGVVAAVVVAAIFLFKNRIVSALSTATGGVISQPAPYWEAGPPTGVAPPPGPTAAPGGAVTVNSTSTDIIAAFQNSGYFAALLAEGLGQDITLAKANAASWLQSHPYLYTAYPTYFRAA